MKCVGRILLIICLTMVAIAISFAVILWIHLAESSEDKYLQGTLKFIEDSTVVSLDKLNVEADAVTVSGFSAGGAMANQLHVAHSSLFSGAAIFSQVFYRCGPKNVIQFGIQCSTYLFQWFPYKVQNAIEDARKYATEGLIDGLGNLTDNRVFIWTGGQDDYIPRAMAEKNVDFYGTFIRNRSRISLVVNEQATHLMPTKSFGAPCNGDALENYYLGNCNYSGAYHSLKFLVGEKVTDVEVTPNLASLKVYNQSEFYNGDIKDVAMGMVGFIYVPKACEDGQIQCLLHVNLHGCYEYPPQIAREYILNNGFLPVAEANNIIVLFPLTTKVSGNMDGCWDFYSYTGSEFATKKGKQVQVIYNIVQRILHGHRRIERHLLIV